MKKYLVIDVYALCFRALYGYPPTMHNNKGQQTSVIVGFFKQFLSRIHKIEDYYPIFVTDMPGSADVRKQMYPDYKSNRTAAPDSFYEQVDFVLELASLIGTVYKKPGYEADDLAGAFVEKYSPYNEVTLLTVDGDWLQLLRDNVTVVQLKTSGVHKTYTSDEFFAEYKLHPKQLISLKALIGDGSDNIPGVPGIGNKTATELLTQFEDIDDIYANIIKVTNKRKIQEKLIKHKDAVMLNRKLVTLNTSVADFEEPQTIITDATIDIFIDKFADRTDSQELTNLLGVYLQKRKG